MTVQGSSVPFGRIIVASTPSHVKGEGLQSRREFGLAMADLIMSFAVILKTPACARLSSASAGPFFGEFYR